MATTSERLELGTDELRRRLDPESLTFRTTEEVEPLEGTIGQPRALASIEFGLEIDTFGYNLFACGAPGSGRETTVFDYLERYAGERPPPDEWIYVHNFDDPDRPRSIRMPIGRGCELERDMERFVESAKEEIPRAFDEEDYQRRRTEALAQIESRRQEITEGLERFAAERNYALQTTPAGMVSAPIADGRPITPEEVAELSPQEREQLEKRGEEVKERAEETLRELRRLEQEGIERVRELDREVAGLVAGPLLDELRERYADLPEVLAFLDGVAEDVPEHLADFRRKQEPEGALPGLSALQELQREDHLDRYEVNVLVHNSKNGAPVVVERNPTYYNLIGRVDYRATLGAMVTDFRQIKPGALHRANGGFLLLHLIDVLRQPFAYEALKRCLRSREIRIENLAEQYSPMPTATLRPEPIELDAKVVLIGPPLLYHLLYALDEDFRELFKVKIDFAPEMDWTDEHVANYAAFVSRCVRTAELRHFDRSAVARVVEHGARLREHQGKLSARLLEISDVVSEASFWAGKAGHDIVLAEDVDKAIAEKEYRSNLLEERIRELIAEGTLMIDVEGEKAGQVNGLSVAELGDYRFGRPTRVTARVSVGRGTVESIEREIDGLSGPIHSKAFLILSGYLAEKYAQEWPLALKATIAFEQSYDEVEGDSASSTELYTLLSALSGLPLRQGIAVTGSVNQHGEVQAVGAVTRKVEGFFAACRAKGLTGDQGVIVPAANVRHLMLAEEIVEAVAAGEFHVWAVRTIDEGLELLTGRPAADVDRLVEERLRGYAEHLRHFVSVDGPVESDVRRRG